MSTNKTDNYQLHLWESSDTFSRPELNDNFTKVDAAVRAAEQQAAGALAEGLSAQTAALSAYQTANDAAVNALTAAMPRMAVGSYVGTGGYGAGSPNTLTFDFAPKLVVIVVNKGTASEQGTVLVTGQAYSAGIGRVSSSTTSLNLTVSWLTNGVSWYGGASFNQLNDSGVSYFYFAVG